MHKLLFAHGRHVLASCIMDSSHSQPLAAEEKPTIMNTKWSRRSQVLAATFVTLSLLVVAAAMTDLRNGNNTVRLLRAVAAVPNITVAKPSIAELYATKRYRQRIKVGSVDERGGMRGDAGTIKCV